MAKELARVPHVKRAYSSFVEKSPRQIIAIVGIIAAILSCYPVVFFGRSFVSPNNGGVPMLYNSAPFIPGNQDTLVEDVRGSDVGTMILADLPNAVVQHISIFKDHEFPLWNRYSKTGMTMLGQGQSMIGDPLHWIPVFAKGAAWSWDLKFILAKALFTVGIGLTVFAATQSIISSIFLALSSAFFGFFAYRLHHPAFFSLCYSPWILYSWIGLVKSENGRQISFWLLIQSIFSWMTLNSGTAKEALILTLFLNLTGLMILLWDRGKRVSLKLLGVLLLQAVATILVTAPHWLNFLYTLSYSYNLYEPLVLFQPLQLMAGFFDNIFYGHAFASLLGPSTNMFIMAGIVWSLVRIRSIWRRRFFAPLFLSACFSFAMVYGLVPSTILLNLPLIKNIQHIFNVFGCVLIVQGSIIAGFGLVEFLDHYAETAWFKDYIKYLVLLTVVAIIFYIYLINRDFMRFIIPKYLIIGVTVFLSAAFLPIVARCLLNRAIPVLLGVSLLALLLFPIHARHGMGLETGIADLDSLMVNPRLRPSFSTISQSIDYLRKQTEKEPYRVAGLADNFFAGYGGVIDLETIEGCDPLMNLYYRDIVNAFDFKKGGWEISVNEKNLNLLTPVLDLLNLKYLIADKKALSEMPTVALVHGDARVSILERKTAWPRAFFVSTFSKHKDLEDFLIHLKNPDHLPFASIQESDISENFPGAKLHSLTNTISFAKNYRLTCNSTSFQIVAPTAGIVVLLEPFVADEFEVTVNGKPTPYFRVNHAFRGVFVDGPQNLLITWTYRPKYWTLSLIMFMLGLIMSSSLFVILFRQRNWPRGL